MAFAGDGPHEWRATFPDRKGYFANEHEEQQERIVQAGAWLAAVLMAAIKPG